MRIGLAYAATLAAFVLIDLIWLGVVARRFYRTELGGLMARRFVLVPAILFYLAFPAGIVLFAIEPAIMSASPAMAARLGAAFGFFAYATYDLTNWATLAGWPARLSIVDMVWGTVLTGVAATVGALAVL